MKNSVLANIAAKRDEQKKDLSVEFPVPTWELDGVRTLLWSFKVVPKKRMDEYVDNKRTLDADVSLLVDSHNGFFFHEPTKTVGGLRLWEDRDGRDRSDYVRVEDQDTGEVCGVDLNFAEVLGFEPVDSSPLAASTQLVLHLFKNNETAIASQAGRLAAWQSNTDLDVTKLMLGE